MSSLDSSFSAMPLSLSWTCLRKDAKLAFPSERRVVFSSDCALGSRRALQQSETRSEQSARLDFCAETVTSAIFTMPHIVRRALTVMDLVWTASTPRSGARRHILVRQEAMMVPRKMSPPTIILRRWGLVSRSTTTLGSEYTVWVAYVPSASTMFLVTIFGPLAASMAACSCACFSSACTMKGASPSCVVMTSKASATVSEVSQYSPNIQTQMHMT
mmetsp:Transcript_16645/g.35141  ORF Transcript_16645/g.35141 Transcript_16645/m.35141 type:complete len:216 (+) Transcript_16645:1085-1732(+)